MLGTFALYQREPGSPNAPQLELISQFTNIASITIERAQRDDALRQSEVRRAAAERELRSMIDTIPVFVAAYQPDGTRSFVNQTWQHYMGLTLEEATGAGAQTFPHFHPDDHAEVNEAAWRASLASGEPLSIEVRVAAPMDNIGGTRPVACRCAMRRVTLSDGIRSASISRTRSSRRMR